LPQAASTPASASTPTVAIPMPAATTCAVRRLFKRKATASTTIAAPM
jgi:hypothetical protein